MGSSSGPQGSVKAAAGHACALCPCLLFAKGSGCLRRSGVDHLRRRIREAVKLASFHHGRTRCVLSLCEVHYVRPEEESSERSGAGEVVCGPEV